MRRRKIHYYGSGCLEVPRDSLEPYVRHDDGMPRPARLDCPLLHDWWPCPCGYRKRGFQPDTWHYDDECTR